MDKNRSGRRQPTWQNDFRRMMEKLFQMICAGYGNFDG
jgi:hypothetical protein